MDTMTTFLNQYFAGELKAYLKSEPIPESNDGPVKVRVCLCGDCCHCDLIQSSCVHSRVVI